MFGAEHAHTLAATTNLANSYSEQGKITEAAVLMEGALATSRRVLGPGHPDTRDTASNLALTYDRQGRSAEAAELCK